MSLANSAFLSSRRKGMESIMRSKSSLWKEYAILLTVVSHVLLASSVPSIVTINNSKQQKGAEIIVVLLFLFRN
jgi:competence protein ComGC